MLFCLPNVLVTDICLSAVSYLVFKVRAEVKGHGVQKMAYFLEFLYTICFKRKKRPDTEKVLMCICVNKILNKKSAI